MKNLKNSEAPFILLMMLSMLAWGGAWVSAKIIAGMGSSQILVFWRYIFTAISLFPLLLFRKESFKINKECFLYTLGSALILFVYSQFFFKGLERGLAGAGGVLLTTTSPLFTYLLMALISQKMIHKKERLGLLLGLIGGVFLLQLWKFDVNQILQSGNIFFLLGALSWAFLSIFSQKAQKGSSVFLFSFYINGIAAVISILFIDRSEFAQLMTFPPFFWLNLLYLSLVGTTFATTAYFFSTQKLGASKASSFVFLVPLNAVILSAIFLKEVPQVPTIIGGCLAMIAVFLINKRER